MYSYVMNEYVHPDCIRQHGDRWTVEYEPVEKLPVVQGSLVGTIYDRETSAFRSHERGVLLGPDGVFGQVVWGHGTVIAVFDTEPVEEHYLCVSYEAGELVPELVISNSWLQEGF